MGVLEQRFLDLPDGFQPLYLAALAGQGVCRVERSVWGSDRYEKKIGTPTGLSRVAADCETARSSGTK